MTNVMARFRCTQILLTATSDPKAHLATLTFVPVFGNGDGKANESWSKYTPSGKLEMVVTNPNATRYFELGGDYQLEFTAVKDLSTPKPKEAS